MTLCTRVQDTLDCTAATEDPESTPKVSEHLPNSSLVTEILISIHDKKLAHRVVMVMEDGMWLKVHRIILVKFTQATTNSDHFHVVIQLLGKLL